MFKAAVKKACPELIEVTGDVLHRDFSLKKVCTQFGLSPKAPFAVINTGEAQRALEDQQKQSVQTPEERYRDGFPFHLNNSEIELRVDLANLCEIGHRVPSWLRTVYASLIEQNFKGIHAPVLITYTQAKQYDVFLHELWEKARSLFDPLLVQTIMMLEMVDWPYLFCPETDGVGLHTVTSSTLFSPTAISKIMDAVIDDQRSRTNRFHHEIMKVITGDFTFWARCGGVKVIEAYGID